jgi:hypothetical protein
MKYIMPFITRAYNRINYNKNNLSIIKISETERLLDEINYYKNIPEDLKYFFPNFYSSKEEKPYSLELEYYSYKNIAHYFIQESFGLVFWESVLKILFDIISRFENHVLDLPNEESKKYANMMLINKTENEYFNLKNKFLYFSNLCSKKSFKLNNKIYLNFEEIWPEVKKNLNNIIEKNNKFSFIHGDFCFSNILLGYHPSLPDKTVKLIDPRGSFGLNGCYGLSIYDYSKLLHSIDGGYESFIYDEFKLIEDSENDYRLTYNMTQNKDIALSVFKSMTDKEKYKIYSLIQGLIFVGMCARHYDDLNRQKAMYLTGVKYLNESL